MTQAARNLARNDVLELARLCAVRDRDAVRRVVTENNQRLFRTAWSILKDRGEAEDAVQAAYLSAFAHLDDFAGRSSLSTWLTRVVINEALGRVRTQRRHRAHLEAEGVAMLDHYREALARGSEPSPPDTLVVREQLRRLLERAIADLPDGFRTVFVLRAIEGLSVEETSEALGIAAATVKTRFLRARRKLQDNLDPEVRTALLGTFPFAGPDCAAMTDRVLAAMGL
jgi:RNA polymerase sigma-70 factor (ECF subfamily)